MLEPDSRALLTDLLRPPRGYTLSHAVGTTFTLSLEMALLVPLSFAARATDDDALGILDAARRAADRVDVFAQAGCIGLGRANDLVALLERSIHAVVPEHGLFHPKVWFLEYEADGERSYRFICSSRNLTNDRTWDAVVALDGAPGEPGDEDQRSNRNMASLLRWLPTHTVHATTPARAARIAALAERWASIVWERPNDVRAMTVDVLGIDAETAQLVPSARQSLIVSPFVTDEGVARLRARPGGRTRLVSRPEQLDRLRPTTLDRLETYILDESATLPDADVDGDGDGDGESRTDHEPLVGLHAKVVVHDGPNTSTAVVGSPNATGPAWRQNVEALVSLTGPTSRIGVDATFDALRPLLEQYATEGGAEADGDDEARHRLEQALRSVAATRITVAVVAGDGYRLDISSNEEALLVDGIVLSWHLLTRPDIGGDGLPPFAPRRTEAVALREITPFVVVTASDAAARTQRSILIADLVDDVPERRDAVVASHITSPEAFARFLRLLLQPWTPSVAASSETSGAVWGAFGGGVADDGSGLMELLVRAVGAEHGGVQDVERVLRQLSPAERAGALPAGFDELWQQITAADARVRVTAHR